MSPRWRGLQPAAEFSPRLRLAEASRGQIFEIHEFAPESVQHAPVVRGEWRIAKVLLAARASRNPASKVSRLLVSIRSCFESLLRNCDGKRVAEGAIRDLAGGSQGPAHGGDPVRRRAHRASRTSPACRCSSIWRRCAPRSRAWQKPKIIEPLVPVDLVVDHSVQVDFAGSADALKKTSGPRSSRATASATSFGRGHAGL